MACNILTGSHYLVILGVIIMDHQRYFGIHFDFHAGNTVEIGGNTNAEDIAWYIEQAKPDFVQCDCKGHPGNSSYPTKVGKTADKLVGDSLRVWVDTVHSYGLPIYVHYSGVMDEAYIKSHPEAATIHEDGKPDKFSVSVFSSYVDDLMIPQLKELVDEYGIDGVWVDGDNWAVYRDYSENAKPYFTEGMTYAEHNRVMREGFTKFINRYIDEVHRYAPNFKIGSNWLYTSQVPEKPSADVDYISGDFDPANSAHRIRFETRCIAHQGKPWDLMSWGFGTEYNSHGFVSKSAQQLIQEAAMVVTQGGGYQLYMIQNIDGSAPKTRTNVYRELGEFMHKRRMLYGKLPIAQVGIVYSAASRYEEKADDPCVYNPPHVSDAIKGVLHVTMDAGYTTDVVLEHQLDNLDRYEIVIVPEWKHLPKDTEKQLIDYAKRGGRLVIIGKQTTLRFGELLGKDFDLDESLKGLNVVDENDNLVSATGGCVDLKQGKGAICIGRDKYHCPCLPLYRTDSCGNGSVTFIGYDLGTCYDFRKSYILADVFHNLLADICPPWISVDRRNIDVTLQEADEGTYLHVINLNQNRHSMEYIVFDEVPPAYNVVITLHRRVKNVKAPLGEEFAVEYRDNETVITLNRLDIHTVLQFEE